jgi:hypothetical protein
MSHLQGTLDLAATHAIMRGDTHVHMCQACGALIASQTVTTKLGTCSACGARRWLKQRIQVGPYHPAWAMHLTRAVHELVTDHPGRYPVLEAALQQAATRTRESAPVNNDGLPPRNYGWQAPLIKRSDDNNV